MHFSDPTNYDSYEIAVEPVRKNPDPEDQDEFIRIQIESNNREHLSRLLH